MRSQTSDIPREDRNAVVDAVITAALTGDPATTHILNEIAGWVGLGLVNLIAFFTPDTVVTVGAPPLRRLSPHQDDRRGTDGG